MSFWGELKRRNVVKVGAAYLVVAWLLIQVVATVMPTFEAPAWVERTLTFVLIIGFPVVLVVAWAFEITPEGIKKTRQVPTEESITHLTGQKLNYLVTGLLVAAVAFLVVDNYWLGDARPRDTEHAAAASSRDPTATSPRSADPPSEPEALPNSVAVIPFSNLSPREEDAYFAAGIHEEILNQLVKLSSLNVIARTSVLQYTGTQKTIPEIARELNVETVMEGSVRFADGRVLVTAQLVDAATNLHLWSESYERDFANIFAIQSDIAMNVANALEAEFSPAEQESIERLPTDSLEAYELYLVAQDQYRSLDLNRAVETIDAALALDPDFARAWVTKSVIHTTRLQGVRADRLAAEQDAMLSSALRAAEIEPDLSEAQVQLATARGVRGEWSDAELAFRRAYAGPSTPLDVGYGVYWLSVGNIAKAHDVFSSLRRTDPLNRIVRGFYLLGFALLGDPQRADQELERGTAVFGDPWSLGSWFITLARLEARGSASPDEIPPLGGGVQDQAREHLGAPDAGLAMLREAHGDSNQSIFNLLAISVWAGHFGDPELALRALEDATRLNGQNALHFWLPSLREVRQLPRFKEFIREIGLVDYWKQFGWPTLCRPLPADDFECS